MIDERKGESSADYFGPQAEHLGIIRFPSSFSGVRICDRRSANPGKLVGGNCHAQPSAAYEDRSFMLLVNYRAGDAPRHIWVVILAICTWCVLDDVEAPCAQVRRYLAR